MFLHIFLFRWFIYVFRILFKRGLILIRVFGLISLIKVAPFLTQWVTLLSFSLILSLSIVGIVVILLTVSSAILLVLFPLLVFIVWAFWYLVSCVLLLRFDSPQRVWGFCVFKFIFSVGGFGNVLDFLIVVVASEVLNSLVVVIVVLFVLIREVKLYPEPTLPFSLYNKLLGWLAGSQHIPTFIKLVNFTNGMLISEDFVDIVDVFSVVERSVEPNLLF